MHKSSTVTGILRVLALIAAVLCLAYIVWWLFNSWQHRAQQQETTATYVQSSEVVSASETSDKLSASKDGNGEIKIDFETLQAKSKDVVGWLRVDGLPELDDPIVQRDDLFYIRHSWDGRYDSYGAIFMEEGNTSDFSDYHTIIYGHNMRDGAMFGSLRKYENAEFFEENGGKVTVSTPGGTRYYQIFAAEYVDPADPLVYTVGFSPSEEYTAFLRGMLDRALYDTGIEIRTGDRVLTLSTCTGNGQQRFAVHAKEITS